MGLYSRAESKAATPSVIFLPNSCDTCHKMNTPTSSSAVNSNSNSNSDLLIATIGELHDLKKEVEDFDVTFDFLPEKFTLASLQKVQETLTGSSLLTANFRRKVADLVQETDEYTGGAGHRPARLFMRKKK